MNDEVRRDGQRSLISLMKARQAVWLQDTHAMLRGARRDQRRNADAAHRADVVSTNEGRRVAIAEASADDDAVYVDSPIVHHHHGGLGPVPWRWIALAILAAAAWYALSGGVKVETRPPKPDAPPPASSPGGDYIEFY
jgi:hypothetical protein